MSKCMMYANGKPVPIPKKFISPPPCPSVHWKYLKAGDCILQHGDAWYSDAIQEITDSPWSHVAMVVEDSEGALYLAEMTSPKLRMTLLSVWIAENDAIYVCRLQSPLSDSAKAITWNWWASKVGKSYGYIMILLQIIPAWWQRLATHLHLPMKLRFIKVLDMWKVCSTCVGDAYKAAGFVLDEGSSSTLTPADLPRQSFLGAVEQVTL